MTQRRVLGRQLFRCSPPTVGREVGMPVNLASPMIASHRSGLVRCHAARARLPRAQTPQRGAAHPSALVPCDTMDAHCRVGRACLLRARSLLADQGLG